MQRSSPDGVDWKRVGEETLDSMDLSHSIVSYCSIGDKRVVSGMLVEERFVCGNVVLLEGRDRSG
jgi:hypothetical protein